jgi:hypothetical protein
VDKRGYLRPQYRAVLPLLARLTPERLESAVNSSLQAFEGDNAQHPIPRVLTEHEVRTLTRGVTQRGTALRMLLEDYYSGNKSYTSVVSDDVVHAIVRRSNEQWYEGAVDPKHIAFPYGPDIMRAPNGKFMVIEDNAGFIGGPGDLALARKLLFQLAPELKSRLRPVDDPKAYYKALVEHARAHAVPAGGEVIMVTDPGSAADNEDKRVSELLSAEGVTVVSPRSHPRMVAGKDGVFLRGEHGQPPRQVGYVFVLGEHRWMDASHPTTRAALLVEEAAEALEDPDVKLKARERAALQASLDEVHAGSTDVSKLSQTMRSLDLVNRGMLRANSPAKGVMDAYYAGNVAMNYVPGVDFVGDKELKSYVDDLVRHYLKEEPLLPSIPVERFGVRDPGEHGRYQPPAGQSRAHRGLRSHQRERPGLGSEARGPDRPGRRRRHHGDDRLVGLQHVLRRLGRAGGHGGRRARDRGGRDVVRDGGVRSALRHLRSRRLLLGLDRQLRRHS